MSRWYYRETKAVMRKTVLVTGASSGIGKATAERFGAARWNVVATMRRPEPEAFKPADNMFVTRLDVQDRESVDRAVAAALERFGALDVLINNAGYGQYGVFEAIPREKVVEQFEVNVLGVMDVTRAVLPAMRRARSGVIINISSGAGIFTLPMISLYSASKFALSFELASLGITVKIVEPHGGVGATEFNARAATSAVAESSMSDYEPFVKRSADAFARMSAARVIDSSDVAEVIFEAATDGTDRLRYLVGHDTRGFIKARREMDDESYIQFLRNHFTNV
jgi:NAD(P)-dependent dehydrogenase (short-subunit alcohol dehydrogenase family)